MIVRPDIIIYRRGNNDYNLIVIECKKINRNNQHDIEYDIEKLKKFTKLDGDYRYKIWLSLLFDKTVERYKLIWLLDGEVINIDDYRL